MDPMLALLYFLTVVVASYTLVLYLRVEWSEWGMVGLVTFMAGVTILAVRSVLYESGVRGPEDELLVMWRSICGIGGAVAFAGVVSSLFRDPPPPKRTARRLIAALVVLGVLYIMIDRTIT